MTNRAGRAPRDEDGDAMRGTSTTSVMRGTVATTSTREAS